MPKAVGDAICNISFEGCPNELVGIELGRISWKMEGMKPLATSEELLNDSRFVKWALIPENKNVAFKVAFDMPEELSNLFGPDILVGIKTHIESKALSLGRDCDGGDGRDFLSGLIGRVLTMFSANTVSDYCAPIADSSTGSL